MRSSDIAAAVIADLRAAFGLLTRLPVANAAGRAEAAWAWPVAGATVGAIAAVAGYVAIASGLPVGPAAGLVLTVSVVLTGALHEDGLADTVDGFFGGHSKERRLAIMKDSQIGSFGALALMLGALIRWSALTGLIAGGHWGVIIAVGALSRVPMAAIMAAMPNARGAGLSQQVGRPSVRAAGLAAALAMAVALASVEWAALPMGLAVALAAAGTAALAKAKVGGQTGDVLGASQQTGEIAALLIAAALI